MTGITNERIIPMTQMQLANSVILFFKMVQGWFLALYVVRILKKP